MGISKDLKGPRLEYVLKKIKGSIKRDKITFNSKTQQVEREEVEIAAGNILFLPTGQSYRLSDKEVEKRGFDKKPNIIGFSEANDNKTAAGRFKLALGDKERREAMAEMENAIITMCTKQSGSITNSIFEYNPASFKGEKLNVTSTA